MWTALAIGALVILALAVGSRLRASKRRFHALEAQLCESESRFEAFLDHNPVFSWIKDADGRYLYVSVPYRRFLRLGDERWRGLTDFDVFPAEFAIASRERELRVLQSGQSDVARGPFPDAGGRTHYRLVTRFPFTDSASRQFIGGIATDVTRSKEAEQNARFESITDELTGLYNRRGFRLMVEQQLTVAGARSQRCALFFIDLDGLRQINGVHGHAGGDRAIVAVAEALRVAVRTNDLVGRIGGDEFVVFAIGCDNVGLLKQRMLAEMASYGSHQGLPFALSISIGIKEFDAGSVGSLEALLAEADSEMYSVKRRRASLTSR